MLFQLLADEANSGNATNNWVSYALIGILLVILVGSMFFMNRRSKKREAEAQALINAVKPGNKVKTIGGICGIVVEVDPEEDTFVLETGSETSGKCYMKFVRQAILESDAVVETTVPTSGNDVDESTSEAAEGQAEKDAEEKAGTEQSEQTPVKGENADKE